MTTAVFHAQHGIAYCSMKLAGEAGEVVEKVAKLTRDKGLTFTTLDEMDANDKEGLAKELGDVLWYVAALSHELGYSLEYIAKLNQSKLADRKARGKMHGSGDNR